MCAFFWCAFWTVRITIAQVRVFLLRILNDINYLGACARFSTAHILFNCASIVYWSKHIIFARLLCCIHRSLIRASLLFAHHYYRASIVHQLGHIIIARPFYLLLRIHLSLIRADYFARLFYLFIAHPSFINQGRLFLHVFFIFLLRIHLSTSWALNYFVAFCTFLFLLYLSQCASALLFFWFNHVLSLRYICSTFFFDVFITFLLRLRCPSIFL